MSPPDDRSGRSSVQERYRALLETGRTLAATLSPTELYEAIYTETARVLEASGFYVSLYDQGRDLARVVFCADGGTRQDVDVSYRGSDSEVIRTRASTLVRSGLADASLLVMGGDSSPVAQSAVSAPMIHHGRIIGSISAQSYEPDTYDEEDLDLLQGIADISAVAIDNAHQFEELARRRREAEQIEEIGRTLTSVLDSKQVLGKVIAPCSRCSTWTARPSGWPTGRGARLDTSPRQEATSPSRWAWSGTYRESWSKPSSMREAP